MLIKKSYTTFKLGTNFEKKAKIVFTSEEKRFSGSERNTADIIVEHPLTGEGFRGKKDSFFTYIPSLSVTVFGPME